jgi:GNAT superfamily N-acetyltransferase
MLTIRETNTLPDHHTDHDWQTLAGLISRYNHELVGGPEWDTDPAPDLEVARLERHFRRRRWFAELDGVAVGYANLRVNLRDDPDAGNVLVYVLPEHRGRGIGGRLATHVIGVARGQGLQRLGTWVHTPLPSGETLSPAHGAGAVAADHPGIRLAVREGFTLGQVERVSRYDFAAPLVDPRVALAEARAVAGADYELVVFPGAAPEHMLDDLARLSGRMTQDVPSGSLTVPVETWDAQRVRDRDEEVLAASSFYRAVARHTPSGTIVALSELARDRTNPEAFVEQWDTVVLPEHRGHRLGTVVKAANVIQLREAEPSASAILTWNAEENRHMLRVNEALGFREVMREAAFEKEL